MVRSPAYTVAYVVPAAELTGGPRLAVRADGTPGRPCSCCTQAGAHVFVCSYARGKPLLRGARPPDQARHPPKSQALTCEL